MQPDPLGHVPTSFVQDVLTKLAPRILAGADSLTVEEEPQSCGTDTEESLPPFLRCAISPPPHLPPGYAIPPTHLLMLAFGDAASATNSAAATTRRSGGEPLRLMVPIHEAVWTLRCRAVARLVSASGLAPSPPSSSSPSSVPEPAADTFELPVISFPQPLPFAAFSTFTVLHTYLHTATLPTHLSSPDSRPGNDDDDDNDDDEGDDDDESFGSDSEDDDDEEDIEFEEADDDDEEDGLLQEQYEGLYWMCRALGISGSDPIYEWLAAAAEQWRLCTGAAAGEQATTLFARRRSKRVADAAVEDEDMSSSCSHHPTPPPG